MKLYKFDYKGTIGNNVITVPTDSQFLIGIGNGDASSTAQLFDGTTEILPEDDKIGEYTCFRMETQGTQFRKPYKAVINGNNIDLYIICKKMSVAYRDETGLTSTEAVQAVKDSGEFVGKDNLGNYEAVGSLYINSGNGKVGSLYLTTGDPDYVAPLALEVNAENEEIIAYGTINGDDGSLSINNANISYPKIDSFIDAEVNEYMPTEITVKINGVEKTVLAFVCQN